MMSEDHSKSDVNVVCQAMNIYPMGRILLWKWGRKMKKTMCVVNYVFYESVQ